MKYFLSSLAFLFSAFAFNAQANCAKTIGEIGEPNDTAKTISVNGKVNGVVQSIRITAWKFNCTHSDNVGLVVRVKNTGHKPMEFDRSSVSYGGTGIKFINPNSAFYIVTEDNANKDFQKKATSISYQSSLYVTVPAYKRQSGSASQKLSYTSGLWYDKSLTGTGFNFADTAGGMIVYYYGYTKAGDNLWLASSSFGPKAGSAVVGEKYEITLNEPTAGNGGRFDTKPQGEASGTSKWGTMTLNFSSCTEATAILEGIDGKQTFNLVKLAGNAGADCSVK